MLERSVFIVGTSTGVGKTFVSAWICLNMDWAYFKPVQSGCPTDTSMIARCRIPTHKPTYSFEYPLPPHIAGQALGISIEISKIKLPLVSTGLVVEGAGGVLTPLNYSESMADLGVKLALPVILVGRTGLGSISEVLTSLEVLKNRGLDVLAIVMSGCGSIDNVNSVAKISKVPTFWLREVSGNIAFTGVKNLPSELKNLLCGKTKKAYHLKECSEDLAKLS